MVPNVLYHTPKATGIDLFLLQDAKLFLIQIASGRDKIRSKYEKFKKTAKNMAENKSSPTIGWFISFFPFDVLDEDNNDIEMNITSAVGIRQLLGTDIYNKLEKTKSSL